MADETETPTHLDSHGRARMVDVGDKPVTDRIAVARGAVFMHKDTLQRIEENRAAKGDVLTVAKLAGIQAAKRTSDLIPLAHNIPLNAVEIEFALDGESASVTIESRVRTHGQTGVEMEALTAVSIAALTIYDMLKSTDRGMVIGEICLWQKSGGKSGDYRRKA